MTEHHEIHLAIDEAPADVLSGATILKELVEYISRFVILTPSQAVILATYILHTHVLDAGNYTPYLSVGSAVMRSGKTRLLEVLKLFVAKPWLTARVSAAVLVRKIAKQQPTLLLDESDTAFSAEKEYAEALRGILNSGFQRGASLCVRRKGDWEPQDFSTFGPKVIAGIGELPPTLKDRSIPIVLKRQRGREAERFSQEKQETETRRLKERISTWASAHIENLRQAPEAPILLTLNDRQQDVCNPLIKIVRLVGGGWLASLDKALKEVCVGDADESLGIKLLADIRDVFNETATDRLATSDLISKLEEVQTSPWADWNKGKGLTPNSLSRLLRPFEIGPRTIRQETGTPKGYVQQSFEDAWSRYLAPSESCTISFPESEPPHPPQVNVYAGETLFSEPPQDPFVADQKSEESPMFMRVVAGVAVQSVGMTERAAGKAEKTLPPSWPKAEKLCAIHGFHCDWFFEREVRLCARCHQGGAA